MSGPDASGRSFRHVAFELVAGGRGRIGSTVYGTLIVLTSLTAAYAAERHNPWKLVELVVTAVLVFWLAYVYAHALSESIDEKSPLSRETITSIADRELGLLASAIAPTVALVLGAVGVVTESLSVWIAIGVGIAVLAIEGVRYAHATRLGRGGTVAILVMNLLLGVCVVVLKVTLVH
jgi:hypothetical protein